ncbi:MAG: ATP-dependent DNA helicase RecG [Anaerolineae bacterium]|nr:ATP-dependent DNA helicase RecG [Anaerolineae bacterium]
MLALEIEQGYQNKAVIGGLKGVLSWWPKQAHDFYVAPAQGQIIDRVVALIDGYAACAETEQRAQAVTDIQEQLAQLEGPSVQSSPEQAAAMFAEPQPLEPTPRAAPSVSRTDEPAESSEEPINGSRLGLKSPVTVLSGVGDTQARRLKRLGIETIYDMLYFFPRRHEDYSQLKPIAQLQYGEQVTVIGTIRATRLKRHRGGTAIVNSIVADGSGSIQATWFNQPYLAEQLKRGRQIVLSGQVDEYLGRKVMNSPKWEALEVEQISTGRLVPVYPLTQGLGANWLRKMMKRTVDYWTKRLPDYLPKTMRDRLNLLSREESVAQMHFPDSADQLARARRRLAFDEFFILQLGVLRQRQQWRGEPGVSIPVKQDEIDAFLSTLPYALTGAQKRTLNDIVQDLLTDRPMSRLIQGDVGSGKTVVAAAAVYLTAQAGYQAAIMAPTEILAEQHFKNVGQLLAEHGVSACLLTGSVPDAEKEVIYAELAAGKTQVAIGTHAIIQERVEFRALALAVVDEQHRFGVRQRGILRSKGYNPHILVMSATPIPRTLALTAYGDLDLSIIDEMPPGRQPIQTKWFAPAERERAYRFIQAQIQKGRQAYIICPLVEESEKIEAKAAVEEHERLQKSVFPDLRLGLLHGRLKGEEKEQVMRQFSEGKLDILVSTSVVEVGIDVPNATVMMIEGANRFGLSQLHQFRGRVGRGEHQSYCILLADTVTDVGEERLHAIEETQDGFVLAQKDLEMRGPGDFFGIRQSGLPELKLASLGDTPLLELARREAIELFQVDPTLSLPTHRLLASQVDRFWGGEGDLS